MHQPRIAFAAEYWGEGAVVCRAHEDRPGPVVDQEFGYFETWTRANAFAKKLNEGLDLSLEQAHQIVKSALLARAEVLRAGEKRAAQRTSASRAPRWAQSELPRPVQLLVTQMDIAIGVYRSARLLRGHKVSDQVLQRGRELGERVVRAAQIFDLGQADREDLRNRYNRLQQELDAFPASAMVNEVAQ